MKTQILTDEQFNSPENQNRDKAIIGYRSIENGIKPLNIARINNSVCNCPRMRKAINKKWGAKKCYICYKECL